MILTFVLLSWQVPRSSVGRALYRESGPSQDGDPDTGNLPFFLFFFFLLFDFFFHFFFDDLLIFPFYKKLINTLNCFFILVFSLHSLATFLFHILASLPFS